MIPKRARRTFTWGFLDLAAFGAAWFFVGMTIPRVLRQAKLADLDLMIATILVCAASAIWIQIRLSPRVFALAPLAKRAELALTLISAREHLMRELRKPFIRALLPIGTILPVFCLVIIISNPDWDGVFIIAFTVPALVAGNTISVGGALDLLIRLCRARTFESFAYILIPIVWAILSIVIPGGLVFLVIWILNLTGPPELLGGIIVLCVELILMIFVFRFAWKKWKRACRVYYTFE